MDRGLAGAGQQIDKHKPTFATTPSVYASRMRQGGYGAALLQQGKAEHYAPQR